MASLKTATLKVQVSQELHPKLQPKILLLSQNKQNFNGLILPSEADEDL